MMGRVIGVLRSPWTRWVFVLVAVGAAALAVQREWDDIVAALSDMPPGLVAAAFLAGLVYLPVTMLSWRAVLTDLGSTLPLRQALGVFFVSQLGKYVPGGVWNAVAASELGADQRIPRRRSLSAMLVTVFVSLVTGLVVGVPGLALTSGGLSASYRWLWLVLPIALALLVPAVMNRLLAVGMRLIRREPLEHPLTTRGTIAASAWSILGWLVAGVQVWFIAVAAGAETGAEAWLRVTGAYAIAWVIGFLIIVVPAGLGAREVVLATLLGGVVPDTAAVLVIVLVSRIVQTLCDLLMAGTGMLMLRGTAQKKPVVEGPAADMP